MIKKMLEAHKKLWEWIFDEGGCRTTQILKKSITGVPLLVTGNGFLLKQTTVGLQGSMVFIQIDQFGQSTEMIKHLILGNYDYCLDEDAKNRAISKILARVSEGGRYLKTQRNAKGNLDFVTAYWDAKELKEITQLLEELDSEK